MSENEPSTELAAFYQRALEELRAEYQSQKPVIVAFSGGVDSSFLLKVMVDALGTESVVAATAVSPSLAKSELTGAKALAQQLGVSHLCMETQELARPAYRENGPDRCYHCKTELFEAIQLIRQQALREPGWGRCVTYGANLDDLGDHRPGMKAAKEHGVRAPLIDLGLNKERIRQLSRQLELPTADKPAMPCLASRIPYGQTVTFDKLQSIEVAEAHLRSHGFRELRVRHHGEVARIELSAPDQERLFGLPGVEREELLRGVKAAGFRYVTLDLQVFRSGRLNEVLDSQKGLDLVRSCQESPSHR